MNGAAQKAHTTAVSKLGTAMESFSEATLVRFADTERVCRELINAERTHRLTLAQEQRHYVDAEHRRIRALLDAETFDRRAFVGRGFWSRLNWLVTGR